MPNKVDRIRRLRLALEAVAQGIEQPAASQIASEALDTDNAEDPIWRMRRAALYAEIGEYVKATKLIKETAADLDKRYRLDRASLWIKSRLAWANWLTRAADAANRRRYTDALRPREFKELLIDPELEIEQIENAAEAIQSQRQEDDAEIVPMFDAGHYRTGSRTTQVSAGAPALGVLYQLDQLIAIVGLPIRINHVGICSGAALSAVKVTYQHSVKWYVWLLRTLQSHRDKPFNRYFGRVAIAQLPGEVSDNLLSIVDRAISFWVERIKLSQGPEHKDDLGHAIAELQLLLFAHSRLTLRMSEDDAIRAFQRGLELAKNPLIRHIGLLEAIGDVVNYAAKAIRETHQGALTLSVLEFPLSSEKGIDARFWPQIVTSVWASTPDRPQDDPRWDHRVHQLIAAAEKGQPARQEAILRLAYLAIHNSLTANEALLRSDVHYGLTSMARKARCRPGR